jgi:hypothetical protein
VDIDRGTGEVKIRRFVSVDDCGNIINPMIGVTHIDIPITPEKVWRILKDKGVAE